MNAIVLLIFIVISLLSFAFSLLLIVKPEFCIEVQKRFYRLINWNIEPVSMRKEIRNTRIMGAGLLAAIILAVIYISIKGFSL